jgi:putative endonuclease
MKSYFVYFLMNSTRRVLYIGVTNDLNRRVVEHYLDSIGNRKTFTGRYNCYYLVHYEEFSLVHQAISREKELKGWRRSKKENLIAEQNPEFRFLNDELGIAFPK